MLIFEKRFECNIVKEKNMQLLKYKHFHNFKRLCIIITINWMVNLLKIFNRKKNNIITLEIRHRLKNKLLNSINVFLNTIQFHCFKKMTILRALTERDIELKCNIWKHIIIYKRNRDIAKFSNVFTNLYIIIE